MLCLWKDRTHVLGLSREKKEGGGEAHISEAQRRDVEAEGAEDGRSLMLRKVLLKPEAEIERPVQRNSLFRTTCKTKDRV
jgi:hypothetical protein